MTDRLLLIFMLLVAFIFVTAAAAGVGTKRAEAAKACYEAAKVNHSITCQQEAKP